MVFPTTTSPPLELEELEVEELLVEEEELDVLELEVELELLDEDDVEPLDEDELVPLELEELLVPIPPLVQPCKAIAPAAIKIKAIFLISTTLFN